MCVYIGEKVVSNLARFVVVVWCFVVLVLTQSYTANLTSFLTVQSLQPTVTNVKDLISKGESVGYQEGTFVYDLLRDLNFPESQLKPFGSAEECDDLLSKGTSKGGIAAAFDEVPYLKDIVSEYCSKYAMVEPSFKTAGFKPSFKTAGFGFVSCLIFIFINLQNWQQKLKYFIFIARLCVGIP